MWVEGKKEHNMGQGHHFSLLDSCPQFIVFRLKQRTGTEFDILNQSLLVILVMITSSVFWNKE